nr:APC family permease [Levilactobacillus namurensis]
MKSNQKSFRLFDAVLMSVVVVMVVESVAPAAAIGPSQFFWWGLLLLFFIPYGLISSELGTTYAGNGGLYDWVRRAFGPRWGGRLAWIYWINYPFWMAGLAVLFMQVAQRIFQWHLPLWGTLLGQLLFIWTVVLVGNQPVSESKWIMDLAAIAKILIIFSLGGLGIYVALTKGVANRFTLQTMLPQASLSSLSNISVIIFNFLGFEVVTTMASHMDNPQKQVRQAIIFGGLLSALFYLLAAFGMGVAIPTAKLSASSGLLDGFVLLVGKLNGFVVFIGGCFLYTLVSEMVSWALGINYVADYAGKNHDLPTVFAKEDTKGMPIGAGYLNGLLASSAVLLAPLFPNPDIFWSFFSLNIIALLLSYTMLFPAFHKLRRIDSQRQRPFRVPGGRLMINLMTWIPEVLLILAIIFSVLPTSFSTAAITAKLPLWIGIVLAVIIGELVVRWTESAHQSPALVTHPKSNLLFARSTHHPL